jgi:hypothetical protein
MCLFFKLPIQDGYFLGVCNTCKEDTDHALLCFHWNLPELGFFSSFSSFAFSFGAKFIEKVFI